MLRHVLMAAALIAAATPALSSSSTAPPPPIPIEALAELPFISDPVLSPDGRRIAARLYTNGAERIGIFTLGSEDPPTIIGGSNDYDLRSLEWAGNDRLLIRIMILSPFLGVKIPVTRLLGYDIAAARLAPIGTGKGIIGDDVIHVDPDGAYILLSSQASPVAFPNVHRIDLATGAAREVQRARTGVWDWFADDKGVVRAGVDYGERRLKLYYRDGEGADLRRIDTRRYQRDDSVIDMIRFVGDTSRGVVISNAETGRFAAYDYDFTTDTRGATLFEHAEVDVAGVIMGGDGRVDGVAFEDDRPRVAWLNPEYAALQRTIDGVFPGKSNTIKGRSRNGDRVLLWSGGAHDPGSYYVFTRSAGRMEAFAAPYDRLQEMNFAEVKPISYRSRDGLTIRGYLTLPPGRAAVGLPLIVMPHGGPFARDSWTFDPAVQFLASRGYAVLQPNFRGSTGYGREFVEAGYGQFGTGMIDDIDDGVDWLTREGVANPARVCIMGGSYGGYAALWAPIRSPDRYRCAVSIAAVTDLRALLRYDRRMFAARRYSREWQRRVEGEERTDLAAISPLQQAARLKIPALIAHGEKDRRVPVSHSRDMARALTRAGTPVESVFYPEAGHSFSRPEDSIDFLRRVEAFLAKHNPS